MFFMGFYFDVFMYIVFIYVYCSYGSLKDVEVLICKMNVKGMMLDIMFYMLFIDVYGRFGLIDGVFGILKRMYEVGCESFYYMYFCLIKYFLNVKFKEVSSSLELSDLLLGVVLNDFFNCWSSVDYEFILDLFGKMVEYGCVFNVNIYGKFIMGFCKVGCLEVVYSLFDYMKEKG